MPPENYTILLKYILFSYSSIQNLPTLVKLTMVKLVFCPTLFTCHLHESIPAGAGVFIFLDAGVFILVILTTTPQLPQSSLEGSCYQPF